MDAKTTARVLIGIGGVLALIGGILAALGTTSVGLFVFYGVLFVAGIGIASYGKKQLDRATS